MEQGLVENEHKEVQKLFGILVKDIMKCFPDEVSELIPCVEYDLQHSRTAWVYSSGPRPEMVDGEPVRKGTPRTGRSRVGTSQ